MAEVISPSLVLLAYKGKVLLMRKQESSIDVKKHPWSFISALKREDESFEIAVSRGVQKETGLKIVNIEFVSKYCYFAKLTDDDVNNINRTENQLLNFFSTNELKKLILSSATQDFVSKHGDLLYNL